YMLAETFEWEEGLDKKFHEAKGFYITMIISLFVGLGVHLTGLSPVKALIYTAVLYGLTAPVMIAIILHVCNNKSIMGHYRNRKLSNILGFITLILMSASSFTLVYFFFR